MEKDERLRQDAQRNVREAFEQGHSADFRADYSSVLGSPEEMHKLKCQFDAMARPLVQVAYGLDIDAAPLDNFIRTGKPDLVARAIQVLRLIQGKALNGEVPAIQHADAHMMLASWN